MGRRGVTGFWHRICAALLCLALAEPSLSAPEPAHASNDLENSHTHDRTDQGGHHHDTPDIDKDDHCHPGLDCFFQAVVALQAIPEPTYETSALSGLAPDKSLKGLIRGFDPPPPRGLS